MSSLEDNVASIPSSDNSAIVERITAVEINATNNKTSIDKIDADIDKIVEHVDKSFKTVTDIYLFDSKGYEKSHGFDHNLIKNIKLNKELMLAGNIKFNDNLKNYGKIADFIDLSGGLETSGLKDTSKIDIFLNNLNKLKNET